MAEAPFFSIITVCYNDAWSLVKTSQSVFKQTCGDVEYIIVDGASADASPALIRFWQAHGLLSKSSSEKDTGVYNAMNKGLNLATGHYVCFMNASDTFADDNVLSRVRSLIEENDLDGLLGWGELNGQIWGSWIADEGFKMASLGFCHQALYVSRPLLQTQRFDERSFKTDSDTLQLGRLLANGARISILPEVLAVRGGEPGISANLERTATSIGATLTEEYPGLGKEDAAAIIAFRRNCSVTDKIWALLHRPDPKLARHLGLMILDTLFQRQSSKLDQAEIARLSEAAINVLWEQDNIEAETALRRLVIAQNQRDALLRQSKDAVRNLDAAVANFEREENARIAKCRAAATAATAARACDMVVSLTSFPARIKTVHFAIQSLLEQTCPPAEIHLWLGADEIPHENWLPGRLRALCERGLQIHFAKRTCHQYDKFLHNADLNADRPFVIVDDDVIYPPTAMAHLWDAHRAHSQVVVGNRCHRIGIDEEGQLAPYAQWTREVRADGPSMGLLPTGAGGVLYPPGFLSAKRVTDANAILSHAPYADDIWLKACAVARGIPTLATALSHKADWYHRYTPSMMEGTLMETNVTGGLNDTQISRCAEWLDRERPGWRYEMRAGSVPA